jgi:hypoxanthine phosphoribosyltransferase
MVSEDKGRGAVKMSVQQNTLQSNTSVAKKVKSANQVNKDDEADQVYIENTATNQFVANKNFFNQSGNWIDAEFREEARLPEVKLKFASSEYFEAVKQEPALAQYFAIAENVTVVWKGKVYRVVD